MMSKSKTEKKAKEPKKEQPRPSMVVFAFRLAAADRDAIHAAAGPGKATRFVLAAALAAARGDQKAFDALTTQSRSSHK
jgi:hypothetical protein